MPWAHPGSRLALIWRRLRGRFGISAPKVAVRTEMPWHWRALSVIGGVAVILVLIAWVFDFGRQFAGFRQDEIRALQAANAALQEEVDRLRAQLAASQNDLQIERAAQKALTEKHSALLAENVRLKEELAVLERLAKARRR